MPGHAVLSDIYNELAFGGGRLSDPGDAGTINLEPGVSHAVMDLISAGAETRTLADPPASGVELMLAHKTDGGDITITASSAYDENGSTTLTFSAVGQYVLLRGVEDASGTFAWRVVGYDGATGPTLNLATIDVDTLSIGGTAVTATASEINQHCDESANVETVAAANILTAAESGKTFFLSAATEFSSTLPAPAAGLRYTFIVAAAPACADYTILANGGANIIKGYVLTSDVTGCCAEDSATGNDRINFEACVALAGDRVDIISDGTSWFARGESAAAGAITFDDVD